MIVKSADRPLAKPQMGELNMQRKVTRKGQNLFYPWAAMEIGDHFYAPLSMVTATGVSSAAVKEGRRTGRVYETSVIKNHRDRPVVRVTRKS